MRGWKLNSLIHVIFYGVVINQVWTLFTKGHVVSILNINLKYKMTYGISNYSINIAGFFHTESEQNLPLQNKYHSVGWTVKLVANSLCNAAWVISHSNVIWSNKTCTGQCKPCKFCSRIDRFGKCHKHCLSSLRSSAICCSLSSQVRRKAFRKVKLNLSSA